MPILNLVYFDVETHPQIVESPRVYSEVENNRLLFKCEFNSTTKEDVARFNVSWYEESPFKKLSHFRILKGRERVAILAIPANSSQFRLGKTVGVNIFCHLLVTCNFP